MPTDAPAPQACPKCGAPYLRRAAGNMDMFECEALMVPGGTFVEQTIACYSRNQGRLEARVRELESELSAARPAVVFAAWAIEDIPSEFRYWRSRPDKFFCDLLGWASAAGLILMNDEEDAYSLTESGARIVAAAKAKEAKRDG